MFVIYASASQCLHHSYVSTKGWGNVRQWVHTKRRPITVHCIFENSSAITGEQCLASLKPIALRAMGVPYSIEKDL